MATVGEGAVEAILWYTENPHGEMPASLAGMDPATRDRAVAAVRTMVDTHGSDYALGVAGDIAARVRDAT